MSDNGNMERLQEETESIDEALEQARALLESNPAAALRQARDLIRTAPDARALRLAAEAHRRLGQNAEARMAELAGAKVSLDDPAITEAAAAQQQGRRVDAKRLAGAILRDEPDDLVALTIAAEASIGLREFDIADSNLRRVLERAPGFLRAAVLLATSLKIRARVREAIALLEGVVKQVPTNSEALTLLAECHAEIGELEAAVTTYRELTELDPSRADSWVVCAQYLRILGRRDESKAAFRKALAVDPGDGAAWWGLTQFFPEDLTEDDVLRMERLVADPDSIANNESAVRVALANIADRRGDHEQAFKQLSEGKRLRLQSRPYDPDTLSAEVDEAIRNFTPELFERHSDLADDSPIFIVGMPRSGSTLVERILGQHSLIEAAGEMQILPKIVDPLRYDEGQEASYPQALARMSPESFAEIGRRYVERSREYRHTGKPKFTDKFNLNWSHASLIRLALPNARILDMRRNAVDCGWSNFRMLFADGHANDLGHIAQLYRDYVRMIDHVDAVAPGAILRVRYEDLVTGIEAETRRMLDFIGVPFERECIDFHLSKAPVATPSSEQVRQPIYKTGIGSAEPYRKWLGPLIDGLGPLVAT